MTIKEIAQTLEVPENIAYGLVRFLESKGLMQTVGQRKEPGAKGKGAKLYALKPGAAEGAAAFVKKLPSLS